MKYTKELLLQKEQEFDAKRKTKINSLKNLGFKTFAFGILIFYSIISLWPFIWSLFASFKDPYLLSLTGLNPIPKDWTTVNYDSLFSGNSSGYLNLWIQNTLVYSLGISLLNATFNLLGGYALAQISMKGKKIVIWYFMVSILVPSQATFIPTYFIYARLGIVSDFMTPNMFIIVLMLSGMANIILTFMARQFFLTQTSEMEESARIEGYNQIQIFFKITLRKMLPLFSTQFVMVFMGSWNNFLAFQLYSAGDPQKMTINAGIVTLAQTALNKELGYGQSLAMSNLSFIPMFFIYSISLKIQLRGIRGGVK